MTAGVEKKVWQWEITDSDGRDFPGGKGPLNVKIFPSLSSPKSSLTLCLVVLSNLITFANSLDPKQAQQNFQPGTEVIKLFSCSTQLSTKFILLINVKMPSIVGILTFISMINTTSERLKARNFFTFCYFSFYEYMKLKFHAQLSWQWERFYNLGAWSWSKLLFVPLKDLCQLVQCLLIIFENKRGTRLGLTAWYSDGILIKKEFVEKAKFWWKKISRWPKNDFFFGSDVSKLFAKTISRRQNLPLARKVLARLHCKYVQIFLPTVKYNAFHNTGMTEVRSV